MPTYTPKPGDVVTTPETTFPMTVEAFDEQRNLCALVGFDPQTNELLRLPQVCAKEVFIVPA